MSASSLSAGSSRPDSSVALSPSERFSGEESTESLSLIERQRMQENRRKKKHHVESPPSEQSIEQPHKSRIEETGETSFRPPATNVNDWVAREPLPMVHVPRIATSELISELREGELERLKVAFYIPEDVVVRVPGPDWKASRPPVGWLCVFEDQLKGGLRFPVPPFVCEVLNFFRIPLAQVVPNGIRILIRFLLTCLEKKVDPTIGLFRYFFQFKKAAQAPGCVTFASRGGFRVVTPDNNMGWKPRYFFARIPNSGLLEEWNLDVQPDHLPKRQLHKPKNYEKLEVIGSRDGKHFSEKELVKYGLSPAYLPGRGKASVPEYCCC